MHGNHKLVSGFVLVGLDVPRVLFTETRQMLRAGLSSLHVYCSAMRM